MYNLILLQFITNIRQQVIESLLTYKKMTMNKVWFITGCSTGFGRELSKLVLSLGYKAAVASRNTDDVKDIVAAYPETAFAVKLDITKADEITSSVKSIMERFGQIDVLVNNAGIGYFGAAEESEENEVRHMFEVNFFGLVNLTNQVLPIMRQQKSGHIVNIASIAGFFAFPALSFYNATKLKSIIRIFKLNSKIPQNKNKYNL